MMDFSHGTYSIEIKDNLIIATLTDSFDLAGLTLWVNAVKQAIESFNRQPFMMLVNELNATGATPSALVAANEYNQWLSEQSLVAKAVIYSSDIYREIDKQNLPARELQNIAFFDSVESANQWLNSQWHKRTQQANT